MYIYIYIYIYIANNAKVVDQVCLALTSLISHDLNHGLVELGGGAELLLDLISKHSTEEQLQSSALALLALLVSRHPTVQERFRAHDGLRLLRACGNDTHRGENLQTGRRIL